MLTTNVQYKDIVK